MLVEEPVGPIPHQTIEQAGIGRCGAVQIDPNRGGLDTGARSHPGGNVRPRRGTLEIPRIERLMSRRTTSPHRNFGLFGLEEFIFHQVDLEVERPGRMPRLAHRPVLITETSFSPALTSLYAKHPW